MNIPGNYPQQPGPSQPTPNRPSEVLTIDLINGESAVYSYWVAPGVTAFLVDFSNKRFYIKAVDPRGIPEPIRIFPFDELVQQAPPRQAIPQPIPPEVNQNGSNYVTVDQFEELKGMIQALATPPVPTSPPNNPPRNKQKGGNN